MRAHVLQHVPFEDVGSMSGWLEARRARLTCTRFFEDPVLPSLEGIDLMIAMGGPMSVNDEEALPWLRPEKALIRQAVERGLAVVGICLGLSSSPAPWGPESIPTPERDRLVSRPCRSRSGGGLFVSGNLPGFSLARGNLHPSRGGRPPGEKYGLREPGLSDRPACRGTAVSPGNDARKRPVPFGALPQRTVARPLCPG